MKSASKEFAGHIAVGLRDRLIGWRGATQATRARLLAVFCDGIGLRGLVTNIGALTLAGLIILDASPTPVGIAWFASVAAAGFVPRLYAKRLRRRGDFETASEHKALVFVGINALYGLLWGLGAVLLLPRLGGAEQGMLLILLVFGTVMGPYAPMPGILYVRMLTTGVPTVIAIAVSMGSEAFYLSLVAGLWLVIRTDAWRGYHLALREELELRQALEEAQASVHAMNRQLEAEASSDPVTGIANRRALQETLSGIAGPSAVILFDIDRFKGINDQLGHAFGDKLLREVASVARRVLRPQDVIARYGGDELAIVMPGIRDGEAHAMAERVRTCLANHAVASEEGAVAVTASVGLSIIKPGTQVQDADDVLQLADAALYNAKQGGRNRVSSATLVPAGTSG